MSVPAPDRITIPTLGSAGSAVGSGTLPLQKILQSITLKYGSVPNTTRIIINYRISGVDKLLLDIIGNTDGIHFVSIELENTAGAGRGVYLPPYLEGDVVMDITLSDADTNALEITLVAV